MNWEEDFLDLVTAKAICQRIANEFNDKRPDHEFTKMFNELHATLNRVDDHMSKMYQEYELMRRRFEMFESDETR